MDVRLIDGPNRDRSSRTLLLLTYHFPPSAAVAVYRMLGLARYLPRFGWKVIVVAPPRMPGEPEDRALLELVPPETEVHRVPFPRHFLGRLARRLAGNMAWAPAALHACAEVIAQRRPDAILTSSPPSCVHLLGGRLRQRHGIPWVADLRDPWFTNKGNRKWHRALDRRLEARMAHRADAIVANTPLNLAALQAAYPREAHKIAVVPNGFEPDSFPARAPRPPQRDRLTLLHAGELYIGRDPRPLFDALTALKRGGRPHWHAAFLGRSTEALCDLRAEIAGRGLADQVSMEDQVPYAEATRRMMASDVLLLLHTPGTRVGIPAKLYEYLGAGRPVLALAEPDGDIAWALRRSGVPHRLAAPTDSAAIGRALTELREELRSGRDGPAMPGASPFTRESMARRIAECLDGVAAPRMEVRLERVRISATAARPRVDHVVGTSR